MYQEWLDKLKEKCAVCDSQKDLSYYPLMIQDKDVLICKLCYLAWYETGINNSHDLREYRLKNEG